MNSRPAFLSVPIIVSSSTSVYINVSSKSSQFSRPKSQKLATIRNPISVNMVAVSGSDSKIKASAADTERLKILVPEQLSDEGMGILNEMFDVTVDLEMDAQKLLREIPHYHGLIIRSASKVTKEVLEAGKKLKVVGRAGVGVDNIDLHAATDCGVLVVNAPTGNCVAAAEHTIALLCALTRLVAPADAALKAGRWDRNKFVGVSLVHKTLAILGLGRIGREVAKRAKGLGMNIVAYDPFTSDDVAKSLGITLYADLKDALEQADFVSPHLPLLESTKNLISKKEIACMKKSVRILNVARGGIINEEDLLEALEKGDVAGAGLDCFAQEPPHKFPDSVSYKLAIHPKVLATPHLGASTAEAQEDVAIEIAQAVRAALNGEMVSTTVNAPAIPPEVLQQMGPRANLAERLAKFALALNGKVGTGKVSVKYNLEDANADTRLLRIGIIRGLLSESTNIPINVVNSEKMAQAHGLKIEETKAVATGDEEKFISIQVNGAMSVQGKVVLGKPILTDIGGQYSNDILLDGYLLAYDQVDKPGMIGKVGTLLGEHGINISDMTVARDAQKKGGAFVVFRTDSIPDEAIIRQLKHIVGSTIGPLTMNMTTQE